MLKTVGFPSTRTGDQTIVSGNLIIGTAGKGIDFSADPHTAGMTSELLDDYEEGTWTPSVLAGGVTFSTVTTASYTKVGRLVFVQVDATVAANADTSQFAIIGLPFALASSRFTGFSIGYNTSATQLGGTVGNSGLEFYAPVGGAAITNAQVSGARIIVSASYQTT
jgi:hypothetical protein